MKQFDSWQSLQRQATIRLKQYQAIKPVDPTLMLEAQELIVKAVAAEDAEKERKKNG